MNYSDSENIKAQKLLLRKKIKSELEMFAQGEKAAAERYEKYRKMSE